MSPRGNVTINIEECKGCGLCVESCPPKCLEPASELSHYSVHPARYTGRDCTGCGICFYCCPEPGAITVFFVNNAIYGMTGGQMAPTTLVGQRSTTSPWGRRPLNEGFPLHMPEMLPSLEAPAYIERFALSDNNNIMKARAVRKALELQRDGAGFTFVEILSPCPTIWAKDPIEARKWIAEKMIPNFPLEVFRDRKAEISETNAPPHKTVKEIVEGECQVRRRHGARTPSSFPPSWHQNRRIRRPGHPAARSAARRSGHAAKASR